ncbi:MAG: biopolymer transporter ExbD [Bacteroidales bacterium]|nr:biopolymer transporter ExbD [Bacteroidales bacterium]
MALKRRATVKAEFSMSSMTDIVFTLLIFFLVTSTFVNPNALNLNLPKSSNRETAPKVVDVAVKPEEAEDTYTYYINRTPVPEAELESRLRDTLALSTEKTFTISMDEDTPVKELVKLMNIAKRNDFKAIMATRPEE